MRGQLVMSSALHSAALARLEERLAAEQEERREALSEVKESYQNKLNILEADLLEAKQLEEDAREVNTT